MHQVLYINHLIRNKLKKERSYLVELRTSWYFGSLPSRCAQVTFVKETNVVSFRITAIRKTRDSSCNQETYPLFPFSFFSSVTVRLALGRVDVSRRTVKLRSVRSVDAYRPQFLTGRNENVSTHRACPIKYRETHIRVTSVSRAAAERRSAIYSFFSSF